MRSSLLIIFLVLSSTLIARAGDQTTYSTPAAGTALRKELLDVIRVPTEKHLGQPVIFKVHTLRATDKWAFFLGAATKPNGEPVDYRKSREFKEDPKATLDGMEAGMLFGGVDALLKKEGAKWRVVEIVYDAGDVHWLDYDKRFGAPRRLIADPIR